jgi:hypothetical protein
MIVTDSQMKDRVRLLLRGTGADGETAQHPVIPPQTPQISPDQALQVLTLAQRTAEDHVAAANRHAERSRAETNALIEQMKRDAQGHAERIRADADKTLAEAHAAAELTQRDAHHQAAEIRRQAELVLAEARVEAERIVAAGRTQSDELRLQAQQRYEDAVGGLGVKREALQRQIEDLEAFDGDYRRRLTGFMQSQLRALWADQPRVGEIPPAEPQGPGGPVGTGPAHAAGVHTAGVHTAGVHAAPVVAGEN